MLVRTMAELESEGRIVSISQGKSSAVRLLTRSDGVGFSVSEARSSAGESSDLWYKNHWEANYIRSGRGVLEDRGTGERWPLALGVVYCVGPADRHRVETTRRGASHQRVQSAADRRRESRRGRRLSADGADSTGSGPDVGRAVRTFNRDAWNGPRLPPFFGRDEGASRGRRGVPETFVIDRNGRPATSRAPHSPESGRARMSAPATSTTATSSHSSHRTPSRT